jgi:Fungal chitosanase of glycosyl hydrolase group 75
VRFRSPLTLMVAVALPLIATAAVAATSGPASAAAGPTAAQLLAKTASCTVASKGRYATDDGAAATVDICRNGTVYHWTSDLDVDCDGLGTSHCNASTDPWYQAQTSFTTSSGQYFTADTTHYFVIPLPSSRFSYQSAGIRPGNVGAVVYHNKIVYAVFADEGPDDIIGEASYATARDLGIDPNPDTGGTDGPVTFIVFTGTVPNPVENNATIDSVGAAAAGAFVGSGGTTTPPTTKPTTTKPTTGPATPPTSKPTTPPTGATSWVAGHAYQVGDVVTYNGVRYKCLQAHTSIVSWEPPNAPALWQRL